MKAVPFRYLNHFVVVPARAGPVESEFIVDSGVGISLVSSQLAAATGAEPTGHTFTGRRMSGQAVEVPLAKLPSFELGDRSWKDLDVAILDLGGTSGPDGISGYLSLSPFVDAGVTVDYPGRTVVVEDPGSLSARADVGTTIPIDVERDGPSLVVYMSLDLPHQGAPIRAEVDMGSDCLILDTRFAADLGLALEDDDVERKLGTDETGHHYARYFTKIAGTVHATAQPDLFHEDPEVMFQHIIHDGLVGTAFLRRFAVTFDLANEQLVFGSPLERPAP